MLGKGSFHACLMTAIDSGYNSTRSSYSTLNAGNSIGRSPVAVPNKKRCCDILSKVAADFAVWSGWRKVVTILDVPSAILLVCAVIYARNMNGSYMIPASPKFGSYNGESLTNKEANPKSSAFFTSVICSFMSISGKSPEYDSNGSRSPSVNLFSLNVLEKPLCD